MIGFEDDLISCYLMIRYSAASFSEGLNIKIIYLFVYSKYYIYMKKQIR